jgi:hypothetical protein
MMTHANGRHPEPATHPEVVEAIRRLELLDQSRIEASRVLWDAIGANHRLVDDAFRAQQAVWNAQTKLAEMESQKYRSGRREKQAEEASERAWVAYAVAWVECRDLIHRHHPGLLDSKKDLPQLTCPACGNVLGELFGDIAISRRRVRRNQYRYSAIRDNAVTCERCHEMLLPRQLRPNEPAA